MQNPNITVHMVVKNEDQWVYYALMSILPYAHKILLTDTGSTDNTVSIIKNIHSPKILYEKVACDTREKVSAVRQRQIEKTQTPWIWVVDGDEIYTEVGAKEVVQAVASDKFKIIVVRRYDLLGDVYHKQVSSVGAYNLFGAKGHLLVRLINKDLISGLNVRGSYPQEGYYDGEGNSVLETPRDDVYITDHSLYHAMYLTRSSRGANLRSVFNRSKYKIEKGLSIADDLPSVFSLPSPLPGLNPAKRRGFVYETLATFITPIKNLKRRLL